MAATSITVTKLKRNTAFAVPATAAVNASDGAEIDLSGISDERLLIILENGSTSAEKTATIKMGNGIAGVSDLAVTLAASEKKCIVIESSKFKNVSGASAGKMIISGTDTNVKVAAVYLP